MSAQPRVRHYSFAAVARADARTLVLGSMPGAASLAASQYYAHAQNQFWPIMAALCGAGRSLPYALRLERLEENRIALWDVLQSCVRNGSLDSAIEASSAEPNDIPALLRSHGQITRICCNGGTAYRELQRHFGPILQREFARIGIVKLPSTSPAHAGMRLAQKLSAWKAAVQPAAGVGPGF
jgi:double-stranded uracil-DNA glycosylase